jgi:hypothetical protein
MAAPGTDTWSFHCSACGKCCNSPPPMSVPELFYHQRRFIGCLTVRRVLERASPRPPSGRERDVEAWMGLQSAT